jgi:hypothetical protein
MIYYTTYGLQLASELPLPELIPAPAAAADAHIRLGGVEQFPAGLNIRRPYLHVEPGLAVLSVDRAGAFLVRGGEEILAALDDSADIGLVRRYLTGTLLALLLSQRGRLVLHASAVEINGKAAAFLGAKGMGKSSIAAALLGRGHRLIADDLVPLELDGAAARAYPGFPQLKLSREIAEIAGLPAQDLYLLDGVERKLGYRLPGGFDLSPLPLTQLYVLEQAAGLAILPLSPQQSIAELLRHTFPTRLAQPGDGQHLLRCVQLTRAAALFRLERSDSLAQLPALAALVESHLAHAG